MYFFPWYKLVKSEKINLEDICRNVLFSRVYVVGKNSRSLSSTARLFTSYNFILGKKKDYTRSINKIKFTIDAQVESVTRRFYL